MSWSIRRMLGRECCERHGFGRSAGWRQRLGTGRRAAGTASRAGSLGPAARAAADQVRRVQLHGCQREDLFVRRSGGRRRAAARPGAGIRSGDEQMDEEEQHAGGVPSRGACRLQRQDLSLRRPGAAAANGFLPGPAQHHMGIRSGRRFLESPRADADRADRGGRGPGRREDLRLRRRVGSSRPEARRSWPDRSAPFARHR